ncbi:F-box only protein 13-like isoform X1 [Arachis ipaensis]|uniref:F-box only protein 13-like isoform X1 n=2 Tax=Arachis ipaensis TaxID=130454 RepID=UPI0007AEEC39|nr:F-box only protein 13-like isoform X1 [Arachis ipaensis]
MRKVLIFCMFVNYLLDVCFRDFGLMERGLKRKLPQNNFSMDELNEDLLERILSWLPTSAFFRLNSVSKRWKSAANSASFKLACSRIPSRDPWFLMVAPNLKQSVVFNSAENSWKRLNYPCHLREDSDQGCMPVAASGGLVCYRKSSGNFIVCNPVTGSCSELPPLHFASENHQSLNAVVMSSTTSNGQQSYKIVLVLGEIPNLFLKFYNSSSGCWEDESALKKNVDDSSMDCDSTDANVVYFLSTTGTVVASNMQRSPSKQYSSVITNKDGWETVYFLSSSGTVVACNLADKSFFEYPRLLPVFSEYSIDIAVCNGELVVVLLSEFLESASLRVWKYDEANRRWQQIVVMPAAMSHEWYGRKVDINCVGAGDRIFICLNSPETCTYIVCDLVTNTWVELPKCCINGEVMEFMSAFSFEPRIEAAV